MSFFTLADLGASKNISHGWYNTLDQQIESPKTPVGHCQRSGTDSVCPILLSDTEFPYHNETTKTAAAGHSPMLLEDADSINTHGHHINDSPWRSDWGSANSGLAAGPNDHEILVLPIKISTPITGSATQESYGRDIPSDTGASENLDGRCKCLVCMRLPSRSSFYLNLSSVEIGGKMNLPCCIKGCGWSCHVTRDSSWWSRAPFNELLEHVRSHFMQTQPDGTIACTQDHCKYVTKREYDLKRHYKSVHCLNSETFACPVSWYKRHTRGFPRKDKLTSHYKNVHANNTPQGQPTRNIQPKAPASIAPK